MSDRIVTLFGGLTILYLIPSYWAIESISFYSMFLVNTTLLGVVMNFGSESLFIRDLVAGESKENLVKKYFPIKWIILASGLVVIIFNDLFGIMTSSRALIYAASFLGIFLRSISVGYYEMMADLDIRKLVARKLLVYGLGLALRISGILLNLQTLFFSSYLLEGIVHALLFKCEIRRPLPFVLPRKGLYLLFSALSIFLYQKIDFYTAKIVLQKSDFVDYYFALRFIDIATILPVSMSAVMLPYLVLERGRYWKGFWVAFFLGILAMIFFQLVLIPILVLLFADNYPNFETYLRILSLVLPLLYISIYSGMFYLIDEKEHKALLRSAMVAIFAFLASLAMIELDLGEYFIYLPFVVNILLLTVFAIDAFSIRRLS